MRYNERKVTIESAYPLAGTLTVPEGAAEKRPAILIIPGTGNSDRDGKNAKLAGMLIYRELAEYLTSLGYVTLRYDKRGVAESGGDYYETGFWDLVDDGAACVEFLRSQPEVDSERVILLGHSEGSMIVPAVQNRVQASGVILLSGAAESGRTAFPRQTEMALRELEQLKGFKGFLIRLLNVTAKARKKNEVLFAKILASNEPVMKVVGKKFNAKWFREHYSYNVMDEIASITCPTLAVTGEKDIQVTPDHARVLAENVKGESEWHILPKMTHVLRKTDAEMSMLQIFKIYKAQMSVPMDQDLAAVLKGWLTKHFAVQGERL